MALGLSTAMVTDFGGIPNVTHVYISLAYSLSLRQGHRITTDLNVESDAHGMIKNWVYLNMCNVFLASEHASGLCHKSSEL